MAKDFSDDADKSRAIQQLQGERKKLREQLNGSRYSGREEWRVFTKDFRDSEALLEKQIQELTAKP